MLSKLLHTLRAALVGTLSLLATATMAQTTINVGPGQTYTTIQSGIDAANSGDTVLVAPGTYNENINFNGKAITVTSAGGAASTIINGGNKPGLATVIFNHSETSASVISGFTIRGGGDTIFTGTSDGGVYVNGASPTIQGNTITANYCHNIDVQFGVATILNNEVSGVLQSNVQLGPNESYCTFGSGIHLGGTPNSLNGLGSTIIGNLIQNNLTGSGIFLWAAQNVLIMQNVIRNNASPNPGSAFISANSEGTVIVQNLIYGNSSSCGGALAPQDGGLSASNPVVLIANNTIVDNVATNVTYSGSNCTLIAQIYPGPYSYGYSGPGVVIVNNIISGSTPYPAVNCSWFDPPSEADQPTFENNILYNAGGLFFGSYCVDVSGKYNNIVSDPEFVSPSTGDYHLKSTSPAIDSGQNSVLQTFKTMTGLVWTKDIGGNPRVQDGSGKGCIIDMGAYEYTGTLTDCGIAETLTSSLNPAMVGQSVTFTAQLSAAFGTPTGDIQFLDGATLLSTQTVSGTGSATFSTNSLTVGSHIITANYQPAGSFGASTASLTQVINGDTTSTALTCLPNPIYIYNTAQLTATVTSAYSTPTGSISFTDNGALLATQGLLSGTTSLTYTGSTVGTHNITATYTPTGSFAASSATCSEVVNALPTTGNTLTASASNLTAGQALTLTATVKAGNTAVTPGQVNFCDATAAYCTDIHLLGTAQLTSLGMATLKFIPAPGSHSYKAVFLGTTADAGSSSNVVSVSVAGSGSHATTTAIAQSGVPGNYTLTATVTGQGTISPTGTVSFLDTSNANYVLGTAVLAPVSGTATLGFLNSSSPATNPYPQSVAVADFNGDGKLDLVVPIYSLPGFNVLLGNGGGTFLAGSTAPTVAANVNNAAVADFNGDGKADIALSLPDLNEVQVLLGNGDGTFNAMPPISVGTVWQVATGDFNGDGKADLVILNCGTRSLTILLGVGNGTFTPVAPATSLPGCPSAVAVGDFNGDGKADLAVVIDSSATNLPGSVTILLGNGDGTFNPTTQNLATGNSPLSIAAGDFNGDGVLDLAIANSYVNTLSTGTMTVLIGKGDGTFTPTAVSPAVGSMPYSVAVGDFNGDGKADLVTANVGDNTVTVLLGNGDGTFTTAATPTAGTGTLFAAVGDFNSDGLSDIAIADNSAGKVTVLLAQETGTATATATVTGISPVGTGTHLVDASYPGDGYYSGSISATTALIAEPVTTTLSLSANPTSSTFGQQVLLTATLNPSLAQNHNASGAVTFYSGSTNLGTGTVSNGVATLTTTALPAGNDSITAAYPGDTNFAASNSSALPFAVTAGATTVTTTTLTAVPTTLTVGHTLTLTATVTPASGATPTGTVTFYNGTTSLGSGTLNNSGVAQLVLTPAVGSYSITASYGGSSTDASSASSPAIAVAVNAISTATALTAVPTSLSYGQALTLSATVTPASGATPTGTVTFYNGTASLGSAYLNNSGVAQLILTPAVGSYSITASYGGSTNDIASASSSIAVSVNTATTTTTLTASPNPAPFGASVTFTATVANSASGSTITPTGNVSFYDGATLLGTASLNTGAATYSTGSLSVGSHNITATYAGGTGFNSSTSNIVAEVVSPADFSISASPASQTVYTGEAASYTVTITPGTGFNLPVALSCYQLPANTTCTFSPSSVPGGSTSSTLVVQTRAPMQATSVFVPANKLRVPLLAGLLLLFIPRRLRRLRNGWPTCLLLFALLIAGAFMTGCTAPNPLLGGTPVGAANITITGTATNGSQTLTHATTVTLNVESLF